MQTPLKEHIQGLVYLTKYQKGELHYETSHTKFKFVVPISDTGDGAFLSMDKASLFMRWIRKQMETNQQGLEEV
jgi:hypothetical protein